MSAATTKEFHTTPAVHRRMSTHPRKDTIPEMALRRELHRRGLRYFVHRRPIAGLRREADIVFPRLHLAVFIDGCFWHGCPDHGGVPERNDWYWKPKIEGNRARDIDTNERLAREGWTVLRFWEHESPLIAADIVAKVVGSLGRSESGATVGKVNDCDGVS
ncbi:MAG: very short patch repair endonuclease [Acidimicrobiales bacterium]|jgi:DNA mismatch endonuclease (patch repair protein)